MGGVCRINIMEFYGELIYVGIAWKIVYMLYGFVYLLEVWEFVIKSIIVYIFRFSNLTLRILFRVKNLKIWKK